MVEYFGWALEIWGGSQNELGRLTPHGAVAVFSSNAHFQSDFCLAYSCLLEKRVYCGLFASFQLVYSERSAHVDSVVGSRRVTLVR